MVVNRNIGARSSLDPDRLARATDVMRGFLDRGEAAGMNLLVRRGGATVYEVCLGLAEIETGRPMAPDTIFRIYSMSKPVTMAAVLILLERGAFGLDEPVSRYLPAFKGQRVLVESDGGRAGTVPARGEVTIRQLLTMTSGIPYPGANTAIERVYQKALDEAQAEGRPLSMAEVVDRIASLPLAFEPGTRWLYGYSHDVAGRLVEVVSGRPFDRFLREEIFDPLGMKDTGFYVPPEKAGRLAAAYGPGEKGPLTLIDAPGTSSYLKPPSFLSGGGGMVSTIGDYANFAEMLARGGEWGGRRILGERTVRLMASDHLDAEQKRYYCGGNNRGFSYGLGVRVLIDPAGAGFGGSIGLFGWEGYASTWFCADPAEDLAAVLMVQCIPYGAFPFDLRFRTMLYAALV
ncbi:MAG: serine hydrolase domain-containing protein [Patescibacteria group bacterium]